jgi:hypothetical protein
MRRLRLWLLALCVAACGGPPNVPAPAAYLTISAVPYSRVVTQAEFNAGTYGDAANEVWFRFDTTAAVVLAGHSSSGGTFTPRMIVYDATASSVLKTISGPQSWWYQLAATTTYYIKVVNIHGSSPLGPTDFDFTSIFDTAALDMAVPAGSQVINDDTSGFAATVYETDGTFIGFLSTVPGGEIGDTLPDGTALIHDRFGLHSSDKLALFDGWTYVTSADMALGATFPHITNDGTQFFVVKRSTGGVYTVSDAGVVAGPIATISHTGTSAAGVSPDGTILYYTRGYDSDAIHRHNLSTDTPLSDLYTVPELLAGASGYIALSAVNEHPGDLLVMSDGTIVTWYRNTTTSPAKDVLLHISAAGTLLHSYEYTAAQIDHLAYATNSPSAAIVWFFISAPTSFDDTRGRFANVVLATGAVDASFDTDLFSAGVNKVSGSDQLFGPSASCIVVTSEYGATTGTIRVDKATVPDASAQSFDFTASGGLSPATFSLTDGTSQTFSGVTVGSGYSIAETTVAGWSAAFTISNGSPPDNITVAAGETVVVTVTNTQAATTTGPGPCCNSTGPGGAPTPTGYGGETPRVIPPGGAEPSYTSCNAGSGQPATASDPTDAQNLTTCKTPLVHLKWTLPDASVRRYGKLAFTSGNGQAVSARVLKWGPVSQVLADRHGSFRANQFTVTLSDTDRAIRTILSTESTRHVDGKELEILIESAANAAASVDPLVLARGVVTGWSFNRDMTVDLTVTDPLGYRYSSVSLDRPIPTRVCRRELFPELAEENSGRAMPIIYGEMSDDYTWWAEHPERVPVGIVPVIYVGKANSIAGVGIPGDEWYAFLIAGHAISCVQSVFASNLEDSPGSVRMDTSTYGSEFLVPGVNVPLYYDVAFAPGEFERCSLMFASGERALDHIEGRVPITVNPWGIEDVGDGSGDTITDMALQFQHFLSYWIVQTYRTGNWGAVPAFGDGTAKVRTSSFLNCSTIHAARVAGGYAGSRYIGPDQKPAREWVRDFQVDSNSRLGVNHQGQLLLTTLDHTRSTSGLTTFTAQDHMVSASFEVTPKVDEVFNVYTYEYGPEPATGRVAGLAQTIRHTASITNHGEREAQALTNRGTRQKATADDVANRALLESFDPPTDVTFALDLRGVSLALGQLVKVTHYQGVGALGWTDRNLLVTGITAHPDEDDFSTSIDLEDWHAVLALGGDALTIDTSVIGTGTIG